jgi:hypothetical protein
METGVLNFAVALIVATGGAGLLFYLLWTELKDYDGSLKPPRRRVVAGKIRVEHDTSNIVAKDRIFRYGCSFAGMIMSIIILIIGFIIHGPESFDLFPFPF